ncbi:MAG: hypothetical protein JWM83_2973 [Candidatus Angelobacter sp.]|nr:hypothetical protein [Candidatus Angelobacter sp.]
MPESDRSRLRELLRRLTGWLRRSARKEPEPPVDPFAYVTAPSPGHRTAAGRRSPSYRKTDRYVQLLLAKLRKIHHSQPGHQEIL